MKKFKIALFVAAALCGIAVFPVAEPPGNASVALKAQSANDGESVPDPAENAVDEKAKPADADDANSAEIEIDYFRPPGTSYELEYELKKFHPRRGAGGSVTTIKVEVLKFGADGLEFKWTWGKPRLDPATVARLSPEHRQLVDEALGVVEGLSYHYRLDASEGVVILNREELQKKFAAALEVSLKTLKADRGELNPESEKFVRMYANSMSGGESMLMEGVGLMLHPLGEKMIPERVYEYKSEMQIPFFSTSIPTSGRKSLSAPDENGVVTLTFDEQVSPEDGRKYVLELIEKLGKDTGKPMPPEELAKVPPLEIRETVEYRIRPKDGWIYELRYRKESQTMGQTQWETVQIKTSEPIPLKKN